MNTYPDPMRDIYDADAPPLAELTRELDVSPARCVLRTAPATPLWAQIVVWFVVGFCLAFLVDSAFGQATNPTTAPTTQPTTRPVVYPKGYVVACYQQPLELLATWKARGVNAVYGPELGNPRRVTVKQWCDEAERLGLGIIGNKHMLEDGGYRPRNLIAWAVDDEPDLTGHDTPPAEVKKQADQFRAIDPTLPVFCSFAGDKLTVAGARDWAKYEAYLAAVDVASEDWYPFNREFARYPISFKGKALDFLKARGAKVLGSFIECNWQQLNKASPKGRAPTPDEIDASVNEALEHGATWIIWFSTAPGGQYGWPQSYDPTSPENAARMSAINARLNPPPVTQPSTLPSTQPVPVPTLEQRVVDLERQVAELRNWVNQAPRTQP